MDLSIIIPSRNEPFLKRTIEDILEKSRGNTEVIAVMDDKYENLGITDPRVKVLYFSEPIGQRVACNRAVAVSDAKYIMKVDAHCAFGEGFDKIMMDDMQDNWTMTTEMYNLHAFDWICPNGHRRYQGASGVCWECGEPTKMDILWERKPKPMNDTYTFNTEPQFRYFKEYRKRPEYIEGLKKGLTETMGLQGSCFLMTRERYKELNICDENFGSWGSQGLAVAIKTWLSGGKCMVSHKTWYAHLFRPRKGDFGFPYPPETRKYKEARAYAHDLFFNNKFDKAIYPLSWLIKRFMPVPEWTEEDINKV